MDKYVRRGDLFWADLGSNNKGCEQNGVRPVLIIQNDLGNKYSPTVIVAVITSRITKTKLPTHVKISGNKYRLKNDSIILLEQIRAIDKERLGDYISTLNYQDMNSVDTALGVSIEIVQEDKIALEKVSEIKAIRYFIKLWLERTNGDEKSIKEDLIKLEMLTEELEMYCAKKHIDLRYYIGTNDVFYKKEYAI